ncbi:uncharacterized protein LOC142221779 [Haematobia irritans]|uniref:uncharacterized protein LOC142221779 n=1 Tax=Haematobia irritans TaxID=7368 RepID=UPI003F4FA9D5
MSALENPNSKLFSRRDVPKCCPMKQYFLTNKAILIDTLEISPRVIVFKKKLRMGNIYESWINVTNKSMYKRRLIYSCDDSSDIMNIFLEADESFQFAVRLQPQTKLNINRRRDAFIQTEHPNLIVAVPILVLQHEYGMPSFPKMIKFPPACENTSTFYEMIIYNNSISNMTFSIKCNNPKLTIIVPTFNITKCDYIGILLKLNCEDLNEETGVIKIRIGIDSYEIPFIHRPIEWALVLDERYINFDPIAFNRKETKTFSICNESKYDIKFHINFRENDEENVQGIIDEEHDRMDKFPWKHFQIEPKYGTLLANSSARINVTFAPIMHDDFHTSNLPPFPITTNLCVKAENHLKCEHYMIALKGHINGPEVIIIPKSLDLGIVYYGEEHCAKIQVKNVDGITECHVDFLDFVSHDDANAVVTPKEGFDLKPCQIGLFHLQFFAKVVGKFVVKLKFKVHNGGIFSTIIRGISQQVKVKCFPDLLDLGRVPICVPQKHLVLLINPLTVPIAVKCFIPEDGIETPLVLNVIDTDEHLPIHVKDPIYSMHVYEGQKDDDDDASVFGNKIHGCGETTTAELNFQIDGKVSQLSYRSVMSVSSSSQMTSYSTEFEEQALDHIPNLASHLLNYLKKSHIYDKPEMEKMVLDEALTALLKIPYFCDMDKYKNYCNMNWNALASDPKEIYCNREIIHLYPNTGKVITIVVIPNIVGRQHKFIELRLCPILTHLNDVDEDPNLKQTVDSHNFLTKLKIDYTCSVPEIRWNNEIDIQDRPMFAGELYEFEMIFQNCSTIGGFFYYEAIPDNNCGTMRFLNSRWKYFIEPESIVKVPCSIEFKKTGVVILLGLIKIVGINRGFPFRIKSQILPPNVHYEPKRITKKLRVLEKVKYFVYIDNATPTTTWFSLKLKNETYASCYPEGAQLSPTGQGIYVVINAFFKDPGIYRNSLSIIMQYETVKKIAITLHVEGMPIFFEPEIQSETFDIGCVLCSTDEDYNMENPNYSKVIRVLNKGERQYRITVSKTKISSNPTCAVIPHKAKLMVKPNSLLVEPMSEDYLLISSFACEECSIRNEFRIDIIDVSEPTRKQTSRFVIKGQFIHPQLNWSRREILMEYRKTHKYQEQPQWEILQLKNMTGISIEAVILNISGPFMIKEKFEGRLEKKLEFSMIGLETKEFFVMLDKDALKNYHNSSICGRIICMGNGRVQKSVNLKVQILVPSLSIKQTNVVIFAKEIEGGTYITLSNLGHVEAKYKWRKLEETWSYVSEFDDSQQLADIILSDIIETIDVEPIDFENDAEVNMTKRYQKYRCHFRELQDPLNIKGILHEIIDELDLMHKRYKLEWPKAEPLPPAEPRISSNGKPVIAPKLLKESHINSHKKNIRGDLMEFGDSKFNESIDDNVTKSQHQENHQNSPLLFFNRNFNDDSASEISDNTSTKTCVYHTMDQIFVNLKLEDSYYLSEPSSEACDPLRSVYFFQKSGILKENQMELCALHLPPVRKGYEVRVLFLLDVVGGESQELRITLVNFDKTVHLSKESVYLGLKPWYEPFKKEISAENITNYEIVLNLQEVPKTEDKLPKFATGYIKLMNEKSFTLAPKEKTLIKIEGIMGFNDDFVREVHLTLNNSEDKDISFRGQGIMPMLAVTGSRLALADQDRYEIMGEYLLLQKIFYFQMFRGITENDEELLASQMEENSAKNSMSCIMDLETPTSASISKYSQESVRSTMIEREKCLIRILHTYVWINNNEEIPNASILEQLLETEKFLSQLRHNAEQCSLLRSIHQEYIRANPTPDIKTLTNLKHFTIQSLPFEQTARVLNMGTLAFNKYRKFIIPLVFYGPGKLVASVRTLFNIPGVLVEFETNTDDKNFIYYHAEEKTTDIDAKPYRNMYEREFDAKTDPKIKHAHSYDIDQRSQHQRDAKGMIKERKLLLDYYNSLNKSVYVEQKHHYIHCKIFNKYPRDFDELKLNVVIHIRQERIHYKPNQQIEDFLYIDLHMGPTLPILLRGTIGDHKTNNQNLLI